MNIQKQKWHDFTRLLITTEGGSVQVKLYDKPQDEYGTTAFLYALWVDDPFRRKSIARRLMDCAEEETRKRGHKSASLEWSIKDTPVEILKWYERRGYQEVSFRRDCTQPRNTNHTTTLTFLNLKQTTS